MMQVPDSNSDIALTLDPGHLCLEGSTAVPSVVKDSFTLLGTCNWHVLFGTNATAACSASMRNKPYRGRIRNSDLVPSVWLEMLQAEPAAEQTLQAQTNLRTKSTRAAPCCLAGKVQKLSVQ